MAETSLGRASLSVTADLSGFTSALDAASHKTQQLTSTSSALATGSNLVTTSLEQQRQALSGLHAAAAKNQHLSPPKPPKQFTAPRQTAAGEQPPPAAKSTRLDLTSMLGIGAITGAFTKFFDILSTGFSAAVGWVVGFTSKVISAGAQFEAASLRLKALTGSTTLGKGLQEIMKAGPSASFDALVEHATRLAALKFSPASIQMLMERFNQLGVTLGNPEKIMALITDKIADMAAEGQATIPALSKLAEEGIPVWDALAARLSRTTGRMVSVAEAQQMVANGMVNVSEASGAIADAANMPGMKAAAEAAANSFTGVWQTVANNLSVLFQKVGGYFVEGFRLESLSAGVQQLFTSLGEKIEEMKPWFLKAGAFIASAIKVGQEAVTEFLDSWSVAAGEVDLEAILAEARLAALDFGMEVLEGARAAKTALVEVYNQVKKIVDLIVENAALLDVQGALAPASGLASNLAAQAVANGSLASTPALDDLGNPPLPAPPAPPEDFFAAQIERMKRQREKIEAQRLDIKVDYWLNAMLGEESADFAGITDQLEGMGEAARLAAEEAENFWDMLNPTQVQRLEEAPWKKFLAENLTPLQQYQNEINKLNLMLDGSAEGETAFAMGSATALKKLKEQTGLGGEVKFVTAITQGSVEDFKATLDAQNQKVDVQQQIREIMEAARRLQEEQLAAQKEIAAAIRAQRLPKPMVVAVD